MSASHLIVDRFRSFRFETGITTEMCSQSMSMAKLVSSVYVCCLFIHRDGH